jgi:hypothetical protein
MELRNVIAGYWNQTPLTMTWNYDYYADGRLNHAYDANDNRFDRKLDYDHAGRLKEAYSGREARGLAPSNPADSPLRQTFGYDVWGNMTSRSARFWKQAQTPHNVSYLNDRGDDTDYDAAGNAVGTTSHVNTFDAAGKQTYSRSQTASDCLAGWAHEIAQAYDGDGRASRREQTRRIDNYDYNYDPPQVTCTTDAEVTYYIYSTALGGAKLVELSVMGDKVRGYVYGGGGRLAKQEVYPTINSYAVKWHHQNAGTPSWVETAADRSFERQEMDPLGAEVGVFDPYLYTPNPTYDDVHGDAPLYVEGGDPFDISSTCVYEGMAVPCGFALEALQGGGAAVAWASPFAGAGQGGIRGFSYQLVRTWEDYTIPGDIHDDTDGGTSGTRMVERFVAVPTAGPLGGQITPRPQTPLPQNPTQRPFNWSLFFDLVNATTALQQDSCKSLFQGIDPIRLLRNIAVGKAGLGTLTQEYFPAANPNAVTRNHGSRVVTLADGRTVRQSVQLHVGNIVINSNPIAAYQSGYGNRYGVDDAVNRAITLIHELGHAANSIFGEGTSRIQYDGDDKPDSARISAANSRLVYDNCFR